MNDFQLLKKLGIFMGAMSLISVSHAAPQPKIINGQPTTDFQAPWQVALISNNQQPYTSYFCSASLLTEKWLVTAAHCAERSKGKPFYAVIGTTDLLSNQQAQIILIKQRIEIGRAHV